MLVSIFKISLHVMSVESIVLSGDINFYSLKLSCWFVMLYSLVSVRSNI